MNLDEVFGIDASAFANGRTPKRRRWTPVQDYVTPEPTGGPNWAWLELWDHENPAPVDDDAAWEDWYAEHRKMSDRIWVAWALPQFRVWDWPDEDVTLALKVTARHVCGVCGRSDDRGCWEGC